MNNPPRAKSAQVGFTLVELLVVVAIAGMLVALALSGFRMANTGWRRISVHDEAMETRAALTLFLKSLLAQCYPLNVLGNDGKQALAFKGDATEIDFLGPLLQRFGTDDIVQYRLRFTPEHALVVGWRFDRSYADDTTTGRWSETVVATGLPQPSFSYFGAADKHSDAAWQALWNRPDALPQLIDVRLSLFKGDEDIVVAPAITATFCDNTSRSLCPT